MNPLERMPLAKDRPESLGGKSGLRERRFKPAFDERARASWSPEAAAGSRTVIAKHIVQFDVYLPSSWGSIPGASSLIRPLSESPSSLRPAQNLEFNLSHSGRHGLIAVAKDRSVGVDIEVRRPMQRSLRGGPPDCDAPRGQTAETTTDQPSSFSASLTCGLGRRPCSRHWAEGSLIDPRDVEVGIGPGRSYVNFDERIWTVESLAISSSVTAAAAIEGKLDTPLVVSSFE